MSTKTVVILLLTVLGVSLGLASQAYAKEEKRKGAVRAFVSGGYHFWELERRGKILRVFALLFGLTAALLAIYWSGVLTPPAGQTT